MCFSSPLVLDPGFKNCVLKVFFLSFSLEELNFFFNFLGTICVKNSKTA